MSDATIGSWLRMAREGARLTLKDLGDQLDRSARYLCDVERGHRGVTRHHCDQLSEVLGLDRTELYARAGHLSDEVLGYLTRRPRALAVLERLAASDGSEEFVEELLAWMEDKSGDRGPGTGCRQESDLERKEP